MFIGIFKVKFKFLQQSNKNFTSNFIYQILELANKCQTDYSVQLTLYLKYKTQNKISMYENYPKILVLSLTNLKTNVIYILCLNASFLTVLL